MKKTVWLLALLLMLCTLCAAAETARDITHEASFTVRNGGYSKRFLTDRDQVTELDAGKQADPVLTIELQQTPCAALYLEFGKEVLPFTVQGLENDQWVTLAHWNEPYMQAYTAFEPHTQLRVLFDTQGKYVDLDLREVYVYSEGEKDEAIAHEWRPTVEKADLMVLVAHPDDELLWLGGTIPYYAGELDKRVLVSYLTCSRATRQLELLNGIWHCGVEDYPVVGSFKDEKAYRKSDVYKLWGGQKAVDKYVVQLLRRYQPDVIVTQAFDGEYGHAAHQVCADSLLRAVELAQDETYDPASAQEFGTWQVKKLYVHKTAEGIAPTIMDWRKPLEYFGGKTGFDVAQEAYGYHKTQPQQPLEDGNAFFYVVPEGEDNSSFVFTLVYSVVGADEKGGDFFENIVFKQ